ncbi:MAG: HisA/HisF-related TIM barrel protein, partial [Planctomycetota bacterium]
MACPASRAVPRRAPSLSCCVAGLCGGAPCRRRPPTARGGRILHGACSAKRESPGMLVYPAVDIANGKCVRLLQGRPQDQTVYYESPVEAAQHWQALGAQALHVVDLDGALA